MPSTKLARPGAEEEEATFNNDIGFDFGDPEVIPVELSSGKYIYLKEPCADDLIQISAINDDEKLNEIEVTLQTICILHAPTGGGKKLTMKDAKKLTARQLKKIGEAVGTLLGSNE